MLWFDIHLRKSDVTRLIQALDRLESYVHRQAYQNGGELNRQAAMVYAEKVRGNILGNRFAASYPPYHPDYERWKERHFPGKGFLRLRDDAVNSITAFRYQSGWMGGIPPTAIGHRGRPVGYYMALHEFGLGGMPQRSVFQPTLDNFQNSDMPHLLKRVQRVMIKTWR